MSHCAVQEASGAAASLDACASSSPATGLSGMDPFLAQSWPGLWKDFGYGSVKADACVSASSGPQKHRLWVPPSTPSRLWFSFRLWHPLLRVHSCLIQLWPHHV